MLDILTRQTVDTAVETARAIAADARHGYDQTERWGPDYDCSSLVIHVWRAQFKSTSPRRSPAPLRRSTCAVTSVKPRRSMSPRISPV